MYRWLVFVHVLGVFGFLMSHGVSVGVALQLRKERDPKRVATLLQFSGSSIRWFWISLVVLLVGGIAAGFVGHWWGKGWIWLSLGLLVVSSIAMFGLARPYYRKVLAAARGSDEGLSTELEEILGSSRPIVISAIGFGTLVVILYLMMFKPL